MNLYFVFSIYGSPFFTCFSASECELRDDRDYLIYQSCTFSPLPDIECYVKEIVTSYFGVN